MPTSTIPQSAFGDLLRTGAPLLDVRPPIEFSKGALPSATNIPLLDNNQRELVGTKYKREGRDAAIALGYQLVGHEEKTHRLERWLYFINNNPGTALYCFRGGQRSQITQAWLAESGADIPRIEGGFKALRQFLITTLQKACEQTNYIVAGGKTGCAKTHLINQLDFKVDLEGRANHRGSAFGHRVTPQPSQIDFENQLAIDFLNLPLEKLNRLFIEDESHSIGSIHLPPVLHEKMKASPLAIIESTVEKRTDVIFGDYIHNNYLDFVAKDPQQGMKAFSKSLLISLEKIRRRLGEELYQQIKEIMSSALCLQKENDDASGHRQWIKLLLTQYYDPMYDYQLGKKADRIVFRGDAEEFLSWAQQINRAIS